jgi:hypothetical protein
MFEDPMKTEQLPEALKQRIADVLRVIKTELRDPLHLAQIEPIVCALVLDAYMSGHELDEQAHAEMLKEYSEAAEVADEEKTKS